MLFHTKDAYDEQKYFDWTFKDQDTWIDFMFSANTTHLMVSEPHTVGYE